MNKRRGLQGSIVEALGCDIISGRIKPGEIIVPERIGGVYEVSRTVVREALNTLVAKGLVFARPQSGTRACRIEQWNLLDPDVLRWRAANPAGEQLDGDIAAFSRYMDGLKGDLGGNMLYDALMASLPGEHGDATEVTDE
jgi:DNA-binding FadR family transcriptional regulator